MNDSPKFESEDHEQEMLFKSCKTETASAHNEIKHEGQPPELEETP